VVKEAMLASERLMEIEEKFEAKVERIVPVDLDEETLRVILYLKERIGVRSTLLTNQLNFSRPG